MWFVCVVSGRLNFKWHNFYWVLIAYFAAMAISAVFSENVRSSVLRLAVTAYLLGLAFLAINFVRDENDLKWMVRAWLYGSIIPLAVGVVSIALFYFDPENPLLKYTLYGYGSVPVGYYPRVNSTLVSASMFCNYLSVSVILLFVAKSREWIGKALFFTLLVTMTACAVFTISVGLGGFILSVCGWIWLAQRHLRPAIAKLSLASGVLIAAAFLIVSIFALQIYPGAPYSFKVHGVEAEFYPSARVLIWTEAFQTFLSDPITGKGLGQGVTYVMFPNTDGSTSLLTDAHNTYLSVAAQSGIIGFAALLMLIFYVLWGKAVTDRPADGSYILNGLLIAFLSAFVYQGLLGSFEDTRYLWVLIGLIPAVRLFPENRFSVLNSET